MRNKVTFPARFLFFLFAAFVVSPAPGFADTYQIFQLTSDQGYSFNGMDDSGHVAIYKGGSVPGCSISGDCYFTFLNGISTGVSAFSPISVADDGTPCVPTVPSGGYVEHGVCNNGREAFTGLLSATHGNPNVYTGPDSADLLAPGGEGLIFMNGPGDIVWDDHFSDHFYEAVDLTTSVVPEPGSVFLVGTGVLAACGAMRRRVSRG